jgi:hypothetical protein
VKVVLTVAALLLCQNWSLAHAQKRVEAGLLLDYLGVSQTQTNNFGVGGRLGYRIHHNVMVEGELALDYGVNFQEVYSNIANGNVTAIEQTSIGVTQGLFGPKFQPAHCHLRLFVTLKGGFIDFRLSPSLIPNSGVASTVLGIRFDAEQTAYAGYETDQLIDLGNQMAAADLRNGSPRPEPALVIRPNF